MYLNFNEILTATMVLFAIIDIIGMLPLIISIQRKQGDISPMGTSIVGLFLMILFLFVGEELLSVMGITVSSFAVAGSMVLFFLALEMIFGIQLHKHEQKPGSSSVVPLAFPIVIGPGTLTSILSLKAEFHTQNIIIAIIINSIILYLGLKFSKPLEKHLGENAINAIQRIFGIILLAIAVKLFASNVTLLI